jgi:carboxyl-terminal processing protease
MLLRKLIALGLALVASAAWCQQFSKLDRDRAQDMLKVVGDEVRKHYYDPKFHGLDWDAKVAEAKQKINEAKSFNGAMAHIAAMLDTLNDSHTFFLPPQHAYHHDFGWKYQMIGDRCFITEVRPKSDAEAKGVKPGDEVLTVNGFTPDRESFWRMEYLFSILRPQPDLRLGLRDASGNQRQVEVTAKIREFKRLADLTGEGGASDIWDLVRQEETDEHLNRARYVEYSDELMILKLPEFNFTPLEVGDMMGKARKHKALIVDLRGNPGGSVETLKRIVGEMFDKDVKIGDRVGKKENKPVIAKGSHNPFAGKLIVLVDSRSASAAELFARVIQIEKRGVVLGDHTSGAVMEARHYDERWGADTVIFYGVSVTDADLIMTDGKSLEHLGVIPDELLLPSASALANNRDPVLARAAESLGVKINAADAGKLLPYEWPPE